MHLIDAPLSHRPSDSSSQVSHGSLAISVGETHSTSALPAFSGSSLTCEQVLISGVDIQDKVKNHSSGIFRSIRGFPSLACVLTNAMVQSAEQGANQ